MKSPFRASLLFLLLSLVSSLPLVAQPGGQCDEVERKIKLLRLEAQYDIERVMQETALEAERIRLQAGDTLMVVLNQGAERMFALKEEAAEAFAKLRKKALSNPINRYLRRSHFERKMEELEVRYEGLYAVLEDEYDLMAGAIATQFEQQGLALENQAEIQIRQIEAECERKIALLLVEEQKGL